MFPSPPNSFSFPSPASPSSWLSSPPFSRRRGAYSPTTSTLLAPFPSPTKRQTSTHPHVFERTKKRKLFHRFFRSGAILSAARGGAGPSGWTAFEPPSSALAPREEEWTGDGKGWLQKLVFHFQKKVIVSSGLPIPGPLPPRSKLQRSTSSPPALHHALGAPVEYHQSNTVSQVGGDNTPTPALKQHLLAVLRLRLAEGGASSKAGEAGLRFKKFVHLVCNILVRCTNFDCARWVVWNVWMRRTTTVRELPPSSPATPSPITPERGGYDEEEFDDDEEECEDDDYDGEDDGELGTQGFFGDDGEEEENLDEENSSSALRTTPTASFMLPLLLDMEVETVTPSTISPVEPPPTPDETLATPPQFSPSPSLITTTPLCLSDASSSSGTPLSPTTPPVPVPQSPRRSPRVLPSQSQAPPPLPQAHGPPSLPPTLRTRETERPKLPRRGMSLPGRFVGPDGSGEGDTGNAASVGLGLGAVGVGGVPSGGSGGVNLAGPTTTEAVMVEV